MIRITTLVQKIERWQWNICRKLWQHQKTSFLSQTFPTYLTMSSTSSFIPRRSARLAAKVQTNPVRQARQTFINEQKQHTNNTTHDISSDISILRVFMDSMEEARGRTSRAVIATALIKYLLKNPIIMARHTRFGNTVLTKMQEFAREPTLEDAVVDKEFRQSIKDLLYVLTGN